MKDIIYYVSSQKDIEAFPAKAKERIARLIEMLAADMDLPPNDFKYMPTVGMGVYELRIKTDRHYRIFYVAKFDEAIYILHAFIKKTSQTSQKDIDKGKKRYKDLLNYRQEIKDD